MIEATVSDTVTLLNDMCVFAPAALTQGNISWEILDELTVKETFTNGGNKVSAELRFNEQGQLVKSKLEALNHEKKVPVTK